MKDCCQEFYDDILKTINNGDCLYTYFMLFIEEYSENGVKIGLLNPIVEVDIQHTDENGEPTFIHSYDWDEGGYYLLIGWAILDLLEPIGAEKADIFVPAKLSKGGV